MARQIHTVRYRKFKTPNSSSRRYSGRVHLQFYSKIQAAWIFVCSKPNQLDLGGARGEVIDDDEIVTCVSCLRLDPEVVKIMDDVPSLDDFQ